MTPDETIYTCGQVLGLLSRMQTSDIEEAIESSGLRQAYKDLLEILLDCHRRLFPRQYSIMEASAVDEGQ